MFLRRIPLPFPLLPAGLILAGLLVPALSTAALYSDEQILAFYDYDRSVPLNPSEELLEPGMNREIWEVTFDSVTGDPVKGHLYLPVPLVPGEQVPVILYVHSLGGSREELDPFCLYIMGYFDRDVKYAIFGIDSMYHGARSRPGKRLGSAGPVETRWAGASGVIDYRRAVDYLQTRDDIDCSEIHLIGLSMGAIGGGVVAAVEDRIRAAALILGGGDWCTLVNSSTSPEMQRQRRAFAGHCESMSRYWELVDPLYTIHLLSPRPLQMHNALFDLQVPTGQELFEAAEEPKEIYWYIATHISIAIFSVIIRNRVLNFFDAN